MTAEPSSVLRDQPENQPQAEILAPLIDEWMTKWPGRSRDFTTIDCRMPQTLWVDVQAFGSISMATLRIGSITFMHQPDDMRLMLRAALEWLDIREADLAEGRGS